MIYARQSTAIIVTVGPVLDASGVAVTTAVVGDFKLSKNGGAPAALNASATLTHRHTGHYSLSLTATDVNTVGTAEAVIDATTNASPMKEIQVLEPATYDVLFADAAPGPSSPTNITAATGVVLSGVTHTGAVIPTVSAVTGLTASNLDAAVSSRMATYTQPTGFLAATFPGTVASTTNITAGTITTTTNLTNLPSIPANWLTAAGIAASALNGKGDWNIGKTGYSLTQAFPANFSALAITAGGLADITQAAADKTWSTASRVLTAGTNIALAKGTGVTGFNDLDAAGVRAAVGLAAANLDTQLDAVPTAAENAAEGLKHDWESVTGAASRSTLNALRPIRNGFRPGSGGTIEILMEDDVTTAYTRDVTRDPTAQPITGVS